MNSARGHYAATFFYFSSKFFLFFLSLHLWSEKEKIHDRNYHNQWQETE